MHEMCWLCNTPPPHIMKNTLDQNLEYPNWGVSHTLDFQKILQPSQHIKTMCLQPMPIYNTFTQGDDNYFNIALMNFAK